MNDEAGEGKGDHQIEPKGDRDLIDRLRPAHEEAIVQWLVTTTPNIEPPPYFLEDTLAYLDRHLGTTSK